MKNLLFYLFLGITMTSGNVAIQEDVTTAIQEVHPHNYVETISKETTCETEGERVLTCKCGSTFTEVIPATGHNFEDYVYNNDATYIKDGTKTAVCICGLTDTKTAENTKLEYTYTDLDKIMYAKSNVNVRDLPSTDGNKIGSLSWAQEIKITGQCNETGWYRFIYNGETVYVSNAYIVATKPEPDVVSGYVKGESGVSASNVNLANTYWNKIPSNVRKHFIDSGWKIAVSGQRLSSRFGYSYSIAGITCHSIQTIYVDNRTSAIKSALVHEVGHYVDASLGRPSGNSEFAAIFAEEKYTFVDSTATGDGHEYSSIREYFASVFSEAILYPDRCKSCAPKSYEFVMRWAGSL